MTSRSRYEDMARTMAEQEAAWAADLWATLEECSVILAELDPKRRRPFLASVIQDLHSRQGGACAICEGPLDLASFHVDHRIPFSLGGGNERGNLQLAHPRCNQSKGVSVETYDLVPYLEDRVLNL